MLYDDQKIRAWINMFLFLILIGYKYNEIVKYI